MKLSLLNCVTTSTAQLIAVGLTVQYLMRSIPFLLTSKLSDLLLGKMLKYSQAKRIFVIALTAFHIIAI